MEEKPLTIISYVFGIIVGIIIVSSFALSFTNLNEAAIEAGVPSNISFLLAISIDLFLLCSSLYIIRGNLIDEDVRTGWGVLIMFTLISIVFNVAHSQPGMMSRSLHAIPPIALCISLELFMKTLKSNLKRKYSFKEVVVNAIGVKPVPIKNSKIKKQENADQIDQNRTDQIDQYFIDHPGATKTQCATDLHISRNTINKYTANKK